MYFFYFYPLGLDRDRRRRPVLTWTLMAVMAGVFAWMRYFPDAGAVDPWRFVFYPGDGPPWTVTTAVFMHAGWFHLLGNLLYLHVIGPPLEDRLGPGSPGPLPFDEEVVSPAGHGHLNPPASSPLPVRTLRSSWPSPRTPPPPGS